MASLQVDVAQSPFPWSVALLASHQHIQIDWLAGKLQYDGKTTVEEIETALATKLKGKEVSRKFRQWCSLVSSIQLI